MMARWTDRQIQTGGKGGKGVRERERQAGERERKRNRETDSAKFGYVFQHYF